jgi:hypothetical protein
MKLNSCYNKYLNAPQKKLSHRVSAFHTLKPRNLMRELNDVVVIPAAPQKKQEKCKIPVTLQPRNVLKDLQDAMIPDAPEKRKEKCKIPVTLRPRKLVYDM